MEQTVTTQQELVPIRRPDQPRPRRLSLSSVSGAYRRVTVKARDALADVKDRLPFGRRHPMTEPGFARAARLTVWAPSAVLGAVTGAALAAATAVWTTAVFWSADVAIGRIVAIATFVVASMAFMVMFASSPTMGETMKRLWAGASVILLFLGGVALLLAMDITFQHFFGASPLGLTR